MRPKSNRGRVEPRETASTLTFSWRGEENIALVFSREKGLVGAPVTVRVGRRALTFGGFYVVMNQVRATRKPPPGKWGSGKEVRPQISGPVRSQVREGRAVFDHVLTHPGLSHPTMVRIEAWMQAGDKAIRFRISARGKGQHLDRLGWGKFSGKGIAARRLFFATNLVINAPIKPFDVPYDRRTTRFWCVEMQGGLTMMQGADSPPRGYAFDPSRGHYDLYTYCDVPITYTLVITGKGPQEAIEQFRRTIDIPAPPSLHKVPGRVGLMANAPIPERYQDFLELFTGRGARDFLWLNYWPSPADRDIVDKYGALYATYDTYYDLWHEGPRKAKVWSPKMIKYYECGAMERGYWDSTRNLPTLYLELVKTRKQAIFGAKYRDASGKRAWVNTEATKVSNLADHKRIARPNALYLDVHASRTPRHYFDYLGRHHSMAEHQKWEARLFRFARRFLGNVPIWSEGGNEAWAGMMDGGMFIEWHPPSEFGIRCADWELYPFLDHVHRERLLTMGTGWPRAGAEPADISAAILGGRPQFVNVYHSIDQSDVSGRLQLYYLTSAFHRMLGLSRLARVEFVGGDIHRQHHLYSNGAQVWVNRGQADWKVQGRVLPQYGYLVQGPKFEQCRERKATSPGKPKARSGRGAGGAVVEFVRSPEYDYFSCDEQFDFGPLIVQGALGVRRDPHAKGLLRRLVIYEIAKPGSVSQYPHQGDLPRVSGFALRLGVMPGTSQRQRAARAWVLLTGGRRLELRLPDLLQEGDLVRVRAAEMAAVLGYEIQLTSPARR
jgi:hypothetical protein